VQEDADASGDAGPGEALDAGPHRCRDREAEEEQCEHEPRLPQRHRADDHTDGDQRDDERVRRPPAGTGP
jgi:hypothetical protein